jgi:hypothetical protein
MIWSIFIVLLVLWLLGFLTHIGGAAVHLLLVVAVIAILVELLQGRRLP